MRYRGAEICAPNSPQKAIALVTYSQPPNALRNAAAGVKLDELPVFIAYWALLAEGMSLFDIAMEYFHQTFGRLGFTRARFRILAQNVEFNLAFNDLHQ